MNNIYNNYSLFLYVMDVFASKKKKLYIYIVSISNKIIHVSTILCNHYYLLPKKKKKSAYFII